MIKRADSLRGQELTHIATDKPTREKLKQNANALGIPLSEYLRLVANAGIKLGKQGQLPAISAPVNSSAMAVQRIENFEKKLDGFLSELRSHLLNL
jgi:hypothetical protein